IYNLYTQINPALLGDKAIDIASDLIFCAPDLAIDLVEKSTEAKPGENALDWAFARLSISAHLCEKDSPQTEPAQITNTIEHIHKKIRDPKAKRLSNSINFLVNDFTAEEVIAEIEKLESTTEKLFMLRQWAKSNHKRSDALEVVEYALKLSIKTTEYAPNACVYREIAPPLVYASDKNKVKALIGMIDSQKSTIEMLGPIEENIRLNLILTEAQYKYDSNSGCNRLIETYCNIAPIQELDIKAACLARLAVSLDAVDPNKELEKREGLHTLASDDLDVSINEILSCSARQFKALSNVIRVLAKKRTAQALTIISKLNTEVRRDKAYINFLRVYLSQSLEELDALLVFSIVDKIVDVEIRDEAVTDIVERIGEEKKYNVERGSKFLPIIEYIDRLDDARSRCKSYSIMFCYLYTEDAGVYEQLLARLNQQILKSWEAIDAGWERVDIGYVLVERLAFCSREIAQEILRNIEDFRKDNVLDSVEAATTYIACLNLAIKAFGGLLSKRLDQDEDLDKLASLIDIIPSMQKRASLWSKLAILYYLNGRKEICTKIVNERVYTIINSIPELNKCCFMDTIIEVAPALYCSHQRVAKGYFSKLPVYQREEAIGCIILFLKYKIVPGEPYDGLGAQGYDLSYDQIIDIFDMLDCVYTDSTLYSCIESIVETVCSRKFKDKFSAQQKIEIARLIEEISSSRLPNLSFIRHDGYKILTLAQLRRFGNSRNASWEDIIDIAKKIPNVSDRAFVLSILASLMPAKESKLQSRLFNECKEIISAIPITLDKVDRYQVLANNALQVNTGVCRESLKLAILATVGASSPETIVSQGTIINIAHRLDPDYANSLVSLIDTDAARNKESTKLSQMLKTLDLKKKIADQDYSESNLDTIQEKDLPLAAWKLLGSLNADRANPHSYEYLRQFVSIGSRFPITMSYPIFAWVVGCVVKKYSATDQSKKYLYPLFEVLCLETKLSSQLVAKSSGYLRNVRQNAPISSGQSSYLIGAGERDIALQVIKEWLEAEVNDYLIICDQYFGVEDLELLYHLLAVRTNCKVYILTSKKHQDQSGIDGQIDDFYRTYWRLNISDQDPPDTEIIIIGMKSTGKSPIHDRWWLTNGKGFKPGTSYNSIGKSQISDITILSSEETKAKYEEIEPYLKKEKKDHNGERLLYSSIYL
ncbi:MAG: hypothetical protein L0226_13620, partial [Acidobacteria bacterium]|nr:hypothetical protein [Acidobacteriota bacterium]